MLRVDIINWLIEKYGYKSYLEIGVAEGGCFEQVECKTKIGVDIETSYSKHEVWLMTSDDFFKDHRIEDVTYDIIFIDGDHHEAQVMRDIDNSLKHLSPGGTIVVHDCNPPTADHAAEVPTVKSATGDHYVWNGTVWRAYVDMRMTAGGLCCRCVDADWGCGVIQRGDQLPVPDGLEWYDISFDEFAAHRKEYLNLITVDEFKEIYAG